MRIGTFILIKNEIRWIQAHLRSWLPFVDEMVFFDGNSKDGTLELLKSYREMGEHGQKIVLIENKDPKDLQDDYVRLFNEALHTLTTDYAIFAHPDMILEDPGNIRGLGEELAYFTHIRSFAGEPNGQLYEIKDGRAELWKNIYRLKNPDMELHYFGHYGAQNEDCYFSKITGNEHDFYGTDLERYPYVVGDSGIKVLHFSDVRPLDRRINRMKRCLENQNYPSDKIDEIAKTHPRVTFENKDGFEFVPSEYPEILKGEPSVIVHTASLQS